MSESHHRFDPSRQYLDRLSAEKIRELRAEQRGGDMLYISIRSVLTGHLSEIRSVGTDIGEARKIAQAQADRMRANSVWLTTGNPTSRYSSLLETFPGTRV